MKPTPFHDRAASHNRTQLWEHWAGYLSAVRYQPSVTAEYYALRNTVGIFDTSPLFKYRFSGVESASFLSGVLARDPQRLEVGRSQYTLWCDDRGHVLEDGVLLRTGDGEFWLTSAKPNFEYFRRLAGTRPVEIEDVSDRYGLLAVQGPHAGDALASLLPAVADLPYFGVMTETLAGGEVMISRTGFTGDLGFEIWIEADHAEAAWDSIVTAGATYDAIPVGSRTITMARLDAGLLLIDADFRSARHAWADFQRETPDELGLGWVVDLDEGRPFIGRFAIEEERRSRSSRWTTVGVAIDAASYEELHRREGLLAPKHDTYRTGVASIYDGDFNVDPSASYLGYATSLMFSPLLKRHIGLAKLPASHSSMGDVSFLEQLVANRPAYVGVEVVAMPLFDPPRKTAIPTTVSR